MTKHTSYLFPPPPPYSPPPSYTPTLKAMSEEALPQPRCLQHSELSMTLYGKPEGASGPPQEERLDGFNIDWFHQTPDTIRTVTIGNDVPVNITHGPCHLILHSLRHYKNRLASFQHEFLLLAFHEPSDSAPMASPPADKVISIVVQRDATGTKDELKRGTHVIDTLSILPRNQPEPPMRTCYLVDEWSWSSTNTRGPPLGEVIRLLTLISRCRQDYVARQFNCYYLCKVARRVITAAYDEDPDSEPPQRVWQEKRQWISRFLGFRTIATVNQVDKDVRGVVERFRREKWERRMAEGRARAGEVSELRAMILELRAELRASASAQSAQLSQIRTSISALVG